MLFKEPKRATPAGSPTFLALTTELDEATALAPLRIGCALVGITNATTRATIANGGRILVNTSLSGHGRLG
ncbi:MAG: hypothetical protein NVS9B15_17250 [Acidobacteriaceae bacterium]